MDIKITMHMVTLNNHVVVTFSQPMGVLQFSPVDAKQFGENMVKMAEELLAQVPMKN